MAPTVDGLPETFHFVTPHLQPFLILWKGQGTMIHFTGGHHYFFPIHPGPAELSCSIPNLFFSSRFFKDLCPRDPPSLLISMALSLFFNVQ